MPHRNNFKSREISAHLRDFRNQIRKAMPNRKARTRAAAPGGKSWSAKNHFISFAIFNHVLSAVRGRGIEKWDDLSATLACNIEGATATIAAHNLCVHKQRQRNDEPATSPESSRVESQRVPYHVQIKNVKCASIWCKHRTMCNAITTHTHTIKQNEKRKRERRSRRKSNENKVSCSCAAAQRSTYNGAYETYHFFFLYFLLGRVSLHQFMQIFCLQTS